MRIDWVLLAEGLGQNAQGALTVISINQNVVVTPELPTTTKRAIVVHVVDDDRTLTEGDSVRFSIRIDSPSGKTIVASGSSITVGRRLTDELPGTFDVPFETVLNFDEYGAYRVKVEFSGPKGATSEAGVDLYVVARIPTISTSIPGSAPSTPAD